MTTHPLVGAIVRGKRSPRTGTQPVYEVLAVTTERPRRSHRPVEVARLRRVNDGAASEPAGSVRRLALEAMERYTVIGRAEAAR